MATPKSPMELKKWQAKLGMSAALGVLVATGFMSSKDMTGAKTSRTLHLCAGMALVGFSYWHWSLYQTKRKNAPYSSGGNKK